MLLAMPVERMHRASTAAVGIRLQCISKNNLGLCFTVCHSQQQHFDCCYIENVYLQGQVPQLQTCMVILTREATLWSAHLPDAATATFGLGSPSTSDLKLQAAVQIDSDKLLSPDPVPSSATDPSPAKDKQQLYGKSICYCPATAMYIGSLGNAQDEDQNVTWLITVDGSSVGQVSSVHVAQPAAAESAAGDSTSAAAESPLQNPDPESDAEHVVTEEDDDDDNNDDEEEDDEASDEGSDHGMTLPSVERSYVVPLLPASRQEMQSPALVLGVPSHGLPGIVATLFESAHGDGTGCALVAQIQDMQVRAIGSMHASCLQLHTHATCCSTVFMQLEPCLLSSTCHAPYRWSQNPLAYHIAYCCMVPKQTNATWMLPEVISYSRRIKCGQSGVHQTTPLLW